MPVKRVIQTFKPSGEWHNSPPGLGDFIRGACHLHEMLNNSGIELRIDVSRTGFAKLLVQDPELFIAGDPQRIAQAEEYFTDHVAMRARLQAFLDSDETELYLCTNAGAWNRTTLPERTRLAMQGFYRFVPEVESALAQGLPVQDYEVLSIRCGDRFYGVDGRPDDAVFRTICSLVENDVLPAASHPVVITSDCHELKLDLARRYGLLMLSHRSRHGAFDDQVTPVAVDMCLLRHSKANHHINAWASWWSGFSHYTSILSGVGGLNFRAPLFACEAVGAEGSLAVSPAIGSAAAASLTTAANEALGRGNLQLADSLCRRALERDADDVVALCLRGHMALGLRRGEIAERLFGRASALRPQAQQVGQWLDAARSASSARPAVDPAGSSGLFLIKAWGGQFWEDVDHVLAQLLAADLSGRTPVVQWGRNSRFAGPGAGNAFERFFEPVSGATVADCTAAGSFFPAKWTRDNLHEEDLAKYTGAGSRLSPLHFLGRDEDVVVSDFHAKVVDLLPWIESHSDYHGLDLASIHRRLVSRHLRLQPALLERIDAFQRDRMAGRRWLAVHARGDDKPAATRDLVPAHAALHARVARHLARDPEMGVLVITDSHDVADDFRARHGARVLLRSVARDAQIPRIADESGSTHFPQAQRDSGESAAIDAFLAARCDAFMGNGASALSTAVHHLKAWAPGSFELVGTDATASACQISHRW
jgi:hypothetical protein